MNKNLKNKFSPKVFALFGLILISGCFQSGQDSKQNTDQNNLPEIPAPKIDLAVPLIISELPADVALSKNIDQLIEASDFTNSRWGIFVVSLKDGRVVTARDGRKLFNPASIQKIFTSLVALEKLGPDFRWKTSVYAKETVKDGVLDGDLILYGRGAPDFETAGIEQMAQKLKSGGLRLVTGDIVGDESYFEGDNLGDGWSWNAVQWYYGAASSALSFNQNQATITIVDGKPRSDDKYIELSGEVKPIEDIEAIGVKRELGTDKIYVWGNGKNLNVRIAVNQPARFSAKILKEVLEKNGVVVGGTDRSVDWKSPERFEIESAKELASVESNNLNAIVHRMNRDSINLYAELILRTLGKKFGETAPDADPQIQKLRGDDLAGAAVIKKWLQENNAASEEIRIHDGSGLSRLDFVTPEAVGRALILAAQSRFAVDFENSLPVAGESGTLRGRLDNLSGKIRAKTGSITYVNSLAGYAKSNGGETLAFVIICNNATQKREPTDVIDQIAAAIVGD